MPDKWRVITNIAISGGESYNAAGGITVAISAPTGLEVSLVSGGTNYDPTATYNVNVSGGTAGTAFSGTLVISGAGIITGITVSQYGNYSNFSGLSVVIPAPGVTATAVATISADPIKIANSEVYDASYAGNTSGWIYAGKTAGSWANGLRIGIIDALADQVIPVSSVDGLTVGLGVTQTPPVGTVRQTGAGTTELMDGF